MNLFYTPDIATRLELPEEESQHAIRVMRMQAGDALLLTDGQGAFYRAEVSTPHPKRCGVKIIERIEAPRVWQNEIVIAVAPTKHMDRMEWFAEKSTEVGINGIVLLRCAHSERREIRADRIRKTQISAMKQSQQAWLPDLQDMTDFDRFIEQPFEGQKFIAYCGEEYPKLLLSKTLRPQQSALVLIGPEGDFSPEEVGRAVAAGFVPVSLGNTRLRTETAALTACHTFQLIQQLI